MKMLRLRCLVVTLMFLTAFSPVAGAERSLADGVLAEMNVARKSPETYVKLLTDLRRYFRGKEVKPPGSSSVIITEEGVAAVDEAIRFLKRQKPLRPLTDSAGLKKAAADLVADQGRNGIGHRGPQSGDMKERIERHGTWRGRIGENISYGPSDPRLVVMDLIIDDGVADRGHRRNIFDRSFGTIGVACGPHIRFRTVCVMDFATTFRKRRE